ncbi:DUF2157 domain-containing protein [Olivibacter sp. SDN3]|uniref:DUF2157 domain-containing protein n=1 Tax=Olivibacter sp. SDN3 TaxID=2764720 RepID=UPI001650FFBA|nr:DUF2157 domain-containing protein [Olivibacter sp. SDN3]QNL50518.1 DUF2157 domain-containing protein [Olivibacter sp. SDN3]
MKLNVDRHEQETIKNAIDHWHQENLIDDNTARRLHASYEVKGFDWRRLAQYSFWIALSCIVLAFLSLFIDQQVLDLVSRLYQTPNIVISAFCAILATLFYYLGSYNKKRHPEKLFSNESLMVLGVFATATSIGYLGKIIEKENGAYSLLFFVSIVIYTLLALKLHSKTIWAFMLIALGIWFAMETAYHSNWGFKFWGMNYPLRFTLFGAMLTAFALFVQNKVNILRPFHQLSYITGVLYLFISLWLLSIFGNYDDLDKWAEVKQFHILYWGVLSTLVSLAFAWYGLKNKDVIAREFGITFLIINLYTRFFEYLWDNVNRAIFFSLLAMSFWIIGKKAEKIWSGTFLKK